MTLEYVSQENNFDTYTIFDTPGPDAAGTKHKESASSALKACDVAIFMIDYGKYLTDSEVSWLEEIKTLFNEKGKFHTLLFAINQIDRALQDKGSKSRIKSIDFIRNRLAEIDQKYQDCVVFATSALDYFNTCELKLAATTYPEIQESLQPGTNWSSALTAVNEAVEDDENLSTIVTNLQKEALGLNNQLKISPAGFHEIREYSGIPQLLSYAKYVIQSKAREEIITDITATIERLSLEIKGLLSKSGNIKILMGKSQEELEKITSILKDYGNDITTILQPKITEDDYKFLENKESESDIAAYIFREKEKDMFSFPVDFTKIIDKIGKKQTVSELMIANKIFEEFQNRQIKKIRDKKDERLYKSELSSLQLSSEELREILSDYADGEMRNYLGQKEQQATLLRDDLVALSNNRFERVEKKTEDCKTKLSKEDCELTLLQTPVWDLNLLVPVIRPSSSVSFKIDLSQVAFLEEVKGFWHSLGKFLRLRWFTEKEFDINFSEKKIKTDLERFRGKFQDDVRSSGFLEYIQKLYDSLDESMHEAADELVGKFSELTENYQKITEEFLKTVDDREKFEGEITAYQELLKNIEDINTSSEEFLRLWDTITHGNAESVKEH